MKFLEVTPTYKNPYKKLTLYNKITLFISKICCT
jgi:hypothetical protein